MQSIGDIVTIGIPSDGSTKDSFEASVQSLATLNDKIGSHDAAHEQDTAAMKDILNTVSALMNQYGAGGVSAEAYEPGSILTEGTKIRVDAIGVDKNTGNVVINEFKSSQTAPLTPNQKVGFPQLEAGGGTVVGNGKGIFTGGFEVPAGTKVEIIRPPK